MKARNAVFAAFVLTAFCVPALFAQIQGEGDIITPTPKAQGPGGLTPYFWIGLQAIFSAGYNFETGAAGFRDHGMDNHTYASFNIAFVDSHYDTPKIFEVAGDPDAWSGKFKLMNFTSRINSYSTREINNPAWLAEISGKGGHIGFFSQAGILIGSLEDVQSNAGSSTQNNDPKPFRTIAAGNKVLDLGDNEIGISYYNGYRGNNPYRRLPHETAYSAGDRGGVMYGGYERPELFNVYITALSEGNVNSNVSQDKNRGIAAALDFGVSPFGLIADDENHFTFNVTGNFIGGVKFENTTENVGFGLKAEAGQWLWDNYVISPVLALDGRLDSNNEFTWKTGAGLIFQLSGMRWAEDEWGELLGITNYDFRYENQKILKYAYAQLYMTYSELAGCDMVMKFEEPDGDIGFNDRIGAMFETRLYKLGDIAKRQGPGWAMQGRFSYDVGIKSFLVTPYIRGYLDSNLVTKLRLGAQANFIPYTGFEIAYTSANLNSGANTSAKPGGLSFYPGIMDAGRLELIVILKSDNPRPKTLKRMDDWNYSKYNQNYY
ncbi:MAG: hypothetical protein FWH38_02235 [Treponema sp.]|nr:hypothetical protein [Treponema sp.]